MNILQQRIVLFILSCFALVVHAQPYYAYDTYQSFPYYQHSTSTFGMQVERGIDQGVYILRILLMGIDPNKVQIAPWGHHLLIRTADQGQARYGNYGSMQGFTMHQSSFFQKVPIPPDADFSRMTRVNFQNGIVLRLPQRRFQKSDIH